MKRCWIVACALVAVTACGGDDDDAGSDALEQPASDDGGEGAADGVTDGTTAFDAEDLGFDSDFDLGQLPSDFPTELVPPQRTVGQWLEFGGQETAGFTTSATFDELVDFYEGEIGDGIIIDDPDTPLGNWTIDDADGAPIWVVGVFVETDGTVIASIGRVPGS